MFVLSKILGLLLTPGTLLLLALLIGCGLLWSRRLWRKGRLVLSVLSLTLLAVTVLPVDDMMLEPLENRFPANPPLPDHVDGIIVLGGSVDPYLSAAHHQVVLNDAAERLVEGARLSRLYPEARLIFTGGSADPLRPDMREAPIAQQALVDMGADAGRMLIEDASRNTYENAVFSQRLAQPQKGQVWLLVTSAKHMPRSVGVFRSVGWPVVPWPVDYTTGGPVRWVNTDKTLIRLANMSNGLHEWAGLLFYRLSGWTDSLFPEP
ncbi:MAG TPA: YdcF family protein [Candidatus Sulfotelmatobacter sp.]|jgi:uncharacterized SAM-binding protein YcdF (DUF218 family)|nr:YdcF family protein [Candidatus Sulfotelmatobacter sp.]